MCSVRIFDWLFLYIHKHWIIHEISHSFPTTPKAFWVNKKCKRQKCRRKEFQNLGSACWNIYRSSLCLLIVSACWAPQKKGENSNSFINHSTLWWRRLDSTFNPSQSALLRCGGRMSDWTISITWDLPSRQPDFHMTKRVIWRSQCVCRSLRCLWKSWKKFFYGFCSVIRFNIIFRKV